MLIVIFLSGCVGQPSATYTTTTSSITTTTTSSPTTTTTTTTQTPTTTTTQPPNAYTIEADDYGFYPSTPITASKGLVVNINFKVRTGTVYYGGLKISSSFFDTGDIAPGENKTVSFIADQNFTYTSYWPSSGVVKAHGQVVVQ